MSIPYVYPCGNTHYYQRKIPKDLLHRYPGCTHIKVNLKTSDPRQIAKKVRALNRQYESLWSSMRGNPDLQPLSVREAAIKLLAQHGLKPRPAENDEHSLESFFEIFQGKHEAYAEDDPEVYYSAQPEEYLDPVDMEALRLLKEEPKFRLSDALEVYLRGHNKSNDKKFRADTERVWAKLIALIGDKEFEQVTRADANEFVAQGIREGSKTTTVERQMSIIRAVFNVVILEREIAKQNPFLKPRIAGLGSDSTARGTFDKEQLSTLIRECKKRDEDVRWLLALQIDLGCRIAEAAGLALNDFHLDGPTPYVSIRPHPWRPNAHSSFHG